MQLYYKIFLVVFVIFIGLNLYATDWSLGFLHEENSKFVFSVAAAVIGLILVFVLHTWSKLKVNQKQGSLK